MWNTLFSVQEKGFHMYFGRFLVFGNLEDRFSHDMAHVISTTELYNVRNGNIFIHKGHCMHKGQLQALSN